MDNTPCQAYAFGMTKKELRALRASTGLSQSVLCKKLGISKRTYQGWEMGRKIPETAAMYVAHMVKCKKLDLSKKRN